MSAPIHEQQQPTPRGQGKRDAAGRASQPPSSAQLVSSDLHETAAMPEVERRLAQQEQRRPRGTVTAAKAPQRRQQQQSPRSVTTNGGVSYSPAAGDDDDDEDEEDEEEDEDDETPLGAPAPLPPMTPRTSALDKPAKSRADLFRRSLSLKYSSEIPDDGDDLTAPLKTSNGHTHNGGDSDDHTAAVHIDFARDRKTSDGPQRRRCKNRLQLIFGPLHRFFLRFPVQVFMFLLLIVDLTFLIIEFVTEERDYEPVTMTTSSCFVLELMVHLVYLGSDFFMVDRPWQVAEVIVVFTSFAVEIAVLLMQNDDGIRVYLRYMRAVRAMRILILWKTRFRHFRASLRQLVSADRRRYQRDGFDLDLTYVYENVLAMSWPSERMESIYRNHIDQVAQFLDHAHPESYWIYNLCSERKYDESKFHNRVTRYLLDDHNPTELWNMYAFAKDVSRHMKGAEGEKPVVVIHCKGGKGRTGTMTCAYLLYTKRQPNADAAMTHFGKMRTSENAKSFQGVESPSQARYVRYFDRLLSEVPRQRIETTGVPTRSVRITRLLIKDVPQMFLTKGIDRLWFVIIAKPTTERAIHYISNPTVTFHPHVQASRPAANSRGKKRRAASQMGGGSAAPEDGCQPFGGNMVVFVNGDHSTPLDTDSFQQRLRAASSPVSVRSFASPSQPSSNAMTATDNEASSANFLSVPRGSSYCDVAFSTSGIPPFCEDITIKFFYNTDDPNPVHPACQAWLHPYFEGNTIVLNKSELDGPHKEGFKEKRFPNGFSIELDLEDC